MKKLLFVIQSEVRQAYYFLDDRFYRFVTAPIRHRRMRVRAGKSEFDPSLDIDYRYASLLPENKKEEYMQSMLRRRQAAHELDLRQ